MVYAKGTGEVSGDFFLEFSSFPDRDVLVNIYVCLEMQVELVLFPRMDVMDIRDFRSFFYHAFYLPYVN